MIRYAAEASIGVSPVLLVLAIWFAPAMREAYRRRRGRCGCRRCQAGARARYDAERLAALDRELDDEFGPGYADRWLVRFHAGDAR